VDLERPGLLGLAGMAGVHPLKLLERSSICISFGFSSARSGLMIIGTSGTGGSANWGGDSNT